MTTRGFARIVKDLNPRLVEELRNRLGQTNQVVKVGLPTNVTEEETGVSLALVGAVHEFGSPKMHIPERPWLRPAVRLARNELNRLNRINFVKMIKGQITSTQALEQLGAMAVGKVQDYIVNGEFAPLSEATVAAKGSSKPLIDTGQMRQNVMYELGEKS
jgi:hypothetical protein